MLGRQKVLKVSRTLAKKMSNLYLPTRNLKLCSADSHTTPGGVSAELGQKRGRKGGAPRLVRWISGMVLSSSSCWKE